MAVNHCKERTSRAHHSPFVCTLEWNLLQILPSKWTRTRTRTQSQMVNSLKDDSHAKFVSPSSSSSTNFEMQSNACDRLRFHISMQCNFDSNSTCMCVCVCARDACVLAFRCTIHFSIAHNERRWNHYMQFSSLQFFPIWRFEYSDLNSRCWEKNDSSIQFRRTHDRTEKFSLSLES